VTEIEGYRRVVDGARTVVDNYRPHIPIQPEWPSVQLGELCEFKNGLNFRAGESGYPIKIVGVGDFQNHLYVPIESLSSVNLDDELPSEYLVQTDDILFVRSNGNPDLVGRSMIVPSTQERVTFSGFTIRARVQDSRVLPIYLAHFFKSRDFAEDIKRVGQGANIRNLSQGILNELAIAVPPLELQRQIVAEIQTEQALIAANREVISRFETKIQATVARIWGDKISTAVKA
jgi:type I restriction enzyme M protein